MGERGGGAPRLVVPMNSIAILDVGKCKYGFAASEHPSTETEHLSNNLPTLVAVEDPLPSSSSSTILLLHPFVCTDTIFACDQNASKTREKVYAQSS